MISPAEQLIFDVTGLTVHMQRSLTGRVSVLVPESEDVRPHLLKSNWDCLRGVDRFRTEIEAAGAVILLYLTHHCNLEWCVSDGLLHPAAAR